MDLCSWAAPALTERRRAGQEEWRKRSGRKGKATEGEEGELHLFLQPTQTRRSTQKTHTVAQTEAADKDAEKPRQPIGSVKGA